MKENIKKVAIYIRVSTLDQAEEGYSLEAQEKQLRKWVSDKKYEVYDLYADRGISGRDIKHRPDMNRLLGDAKERKFDVVLFWSLSRFTRSVSDLYNSMSFFNKLDIGLVSYTEAFDTESPMGRAMIGVMGVFAQYESEVTGERVATAMLERAQQGKRTCSCVLGYDIDGKHSFTINEKEAEYVRFCFNEYLLRKNLSEVAAEARRRGFRGKRGKKPTAYSVQKIITRPVYCGYNSFKGMRFMGTHPPIVTPETFDRVQKIMKRMGKECGRTRVHWN